MNQTLFLSAVSRRVVLTLCLWSYPIKFTSKSQINFVFDKKLIFSAFCSVLLFYETYPHSSFDKKIMNEARIKQVFLVKK